MAKMRSHFLNNFFNVFLGACIVVAVLNCARGGDDIGSTVGTDNVITATITGPNGDTLSGALVTLYQYDTQEATSAFAAKASIAEVVADNWVDFEYTDTNGRIEIEVDTTAHYFMTAEWHEGTEAFSVWIDSLTHKSDSDSTVSLKPAKDVVFQITEDPTVTVEVMVSGKPVRYVRDLNGAVVIPNMPEGEYEIVFKITSDESTGLAEEFTVDELVVDHGKEMIDTVSIKIIEAYSYGCPMGDTLKCVESLDLARECSATQVFDWTNSVCIARPDPISSGLSSYGEIVFDFSSSEAVLSSSSVMLSSSKVIVPSSSDAGDSLGQSSSAALLSSVVQQVDKDPILLSSADDLIVVDTAIVDTASGDSLLSSVTPLSSSSSEPEIVISSSVIVSSSSLVIVSSSSESVMRGALPSIIDTSLVVATDSMVAASQGSIEVTTTSIYNASYPGWLAFDREFDMDKAWVSTNAFDTVGSTANNMYRFGETKRIKEYRIMGRYDTLKDRLPKKWVLQGSNDETVAVEDAVDVSTWTTIDTQFSIDTNDEWQSSTGYDTIAFTVDKPADYLIYRLCVQEVNGSSLVDIIEISLMEEPIQNITIPTTEIDHDRVSTNTITSDSRFATWKLFDGASNWTQWGSGSEVDFTVISTGTANVMYAFDTQQKVLEYVLRGRYESLNDRLPKDWILQGANSSSVKVTDDIANADWTTVDTRSNIVVDVDWIDIGFKSTELTFVLNQPGEYQYYRICISAVNGSDMADLIEMTFMGRPD